MFIPLGDYLPDLPDLNNPGLTVANNTVPLAGTYTDINDISTVTNALDGTCYGGFAAKNASDVPIIFAGTADKLYVSAANVFGDISSTVYGGTSWGFCQYGSRIIATDYVDAVQTYNIGTDTVCSALFTDFKAKYIGIVKDFVVYAYTNDTVDGAQSKRVRWTALGDPTSAAISATTQADFQNLEGSGVGGAIQGFVGGQYGVVIQENSIWRMTFVGSPPVFQFDEVEKGRGTRYPNSIASAGRNVIYLGHDGFALFDGNMSTPIGDGKVNKTFLANLNKSYASNMSAAIDPTNNLYTLSYPSINSGNGVPDSLLIYNINVGRFSTASISVERLLSSFTTAYTLEQLDNINSNLDLLPASLDSTVYQGGDFTIAGFDPNHKFGFLSGPKLDATFETAEFSPTANGTTRVEDIRPTVTTGGTVTVSVGHRAIETDPLVYTTAVATNSIGTCDFRVDDRYLRARLTISGGFTKASGLDANVLPGGSR